MWSWKSNYKTFRKAFFCLLLFIPAAGLALTPLPAAAKDMKVWKDSLPQEHKAISEDTPVWAHMAAAGHVLSPNSAAKRGGRQVWPDLSGGKPSDERLPPGKLMLNDLLRFADASLYTWTGPLRWDGGDWLKLGGTLAGTAVISLADQPVRDFWQQRNGRGWEAIETAGFHYGKPYAAMALTGGFYLGGIIFRNEWARETGIILGSAFLTSATIQTLMKTAAGRARPGTGKGNRAFKPFSELPDYHSFPSGHIQVALSTALVLGRRVQHPALKALFYTAAGATFISRMHSDAHWISDLAFGGAISWFCADAVIRRMENRRSKVPFRKEPPVSWDLAPSVNGLTLRGTFK